MSHSLFAFRILSAQAVTAGQKVYEVHGANSLPVGATAVAAPLKAAKQGGAIRFSIYSSAAVKVTVHVTPEGGTLASGVVNGDTVLLAGGLSGFVTDIPRGATFDLSFDGSTTVSIFPNLVLGAVA